MHIRYVPTCVDPESLARGSPTQTFLMREESIQIALIADHHRPATETPFKWRFAGGPIMALILNAGLVAL